MFLLKKRNKYLILITFLTIYVISRLLNPYTCGRVKIEFDSSWQEYSSGNFLFKYTLEGRGALLDTSSTLKKGVPDIIINTALQLQAMEDLMQYLGFQLPLKSKRYKSQRASKILVVFHYREKSNGSAFDEVRRIAESGIYTRFDKCALLITLGSHIKTDNLTPAHEYFHLVQYGYTMFKAGWYLEGLARWSETLLGNRPFRPEAIPTTDSDLEELWKKRYAAVGVWQGLIEQCDSTNHQVNIPKELLKLKYTNGKPVVIDNSIPGHTYVLNLLKALDKADKKVGNAQDWKSYYWKESDQRSSKFNDEIWKVALDNCLK